MRTIAVRIFHEGKYFCNWLDFKFFPENGSIHHFVFGEVKISGVLRQPLDGRFAQEILELEPVGSNGDLREVLLKNRFMEIDFPETAKK